MRSLNRFCVLVVLTTAPSQVIAQPKGQWLPVEMMQVRRIGRVEVSPDGKRVVYAVRQPVMEEGKSEYLWHIYLANADGSGTTQLTNGPKSCDDPQWSPDGDWIAFLSARSGKRNVWLVSPKGGEAVQLTTMKTAVSSFKWSPDSKQIAFIAMDGPTLQDDKAKKRKNDARVVDENIKMSRLYLVPVAAAGKHKEQLLTTGDFSISATGRAGYDWSSDGKRVVYTYQRTPSPDDWPTARIGAQTGPGQNVVFMKDSKAARFSPLWAPNGSAIAYVASDDPPTWAGAGKVHVVYYGGGKKAIELAGTHDGWGRYSDLIGWAADGKSIYFTEMHGTATRVGRLPLDGPPEILGEVNGVATGIHLNAGRTHFGFCWETLDKAPEACISSVERFEPKPVSRVNVNLPSFPLGKTEVIRWKSKDGLDIEGLLTYPVNYEKGKRYPLLLNVHGGPAGVFTQTFVASPGLYPLATFSGRGYAVLRPNPRGSSGYGEKFRHANYNDWGGGDFQDLMTGVDHVIKIGIADESRLGIMGWSYGGYMTSWTITQTTRFKAASVGAGVTNLMSFTGTADIPSFLPDYFGGEFWNKPDTYRKHSAMFNIKGATTPTLIQHGERDERVPLSQGLELYNALKRQGCTTKMVIYPRTPHGIEEPWLLVDCMERNLEWFDRHLGNARP